MEILIFNWRDIKNPKKGGAEIILYELSKRLIQKNNKVTWFSSSFNGARPTEITEGIKIVRKGNQFTVFLHAILYYLRLKKKPDLVLDCVNTLCWQTPLFVKGNKILYANQSAREVFFYEFPLPLAFIGYILEPFQYFLYKNTKAICYSNSIKDDLLSFGLKRENIKVFSLGIDHLKYKPSIKSKIPTFIFVARFVRNKRPDRCIKAMKQVIEKYPKSKLYLVGYGSEEARMKELIHSLKLDKNVLIINKNNQYLERDRKDMKVKLMQNAWGLLLPSVKEGWGMVVTEAAACGTLSIVSDVTGLKDSVIHNQTGIILSKDPTPHELSSTMLKIISQKQLRDRLSKNAKQFAQKYTWEKSFEVFYKHILQIFRH